MATTKINHLRRNFLYEEVIGACGTDDENLYVRQGDGKIRAYPLDGCTIEHTNVAGKAWLRLRDVAWMLANGPLKPKETVRQTVPHSLRAEHLMKLGLAEATNAGLKTRSNTGFRGVSRDTSAKAPKFMASIVLNGKVVRICSSPYLEEAINARRGWERKLYGKELVETPEDLDALLAFEAESVKKLKRFDDVESPPA